MGQIQLRPFGQWEVFQVGLLQLNSIGQSAFHRHHEIETVELFLCLFVVAGMERVATQVNRVGSAIGLPDTAELSDKPGKVTTGNLFFLTFTGHGSTFHF